MRNVQELIIYKKFKHNTLFYQLAEIFAFCQSCELMEAEDVLEDVEYYKNLAYESVYQILNLAVELGLEGNLWHSFLGFLLANNENPFSMSCEMNKSVQGSIHQIAKKDYEIFLDLFRVSLKQADDVLGIQCFSMIEKFEPSDETGKVFNKRVRDNICQLGRQLAQATDVTQFWSIMTEFYGTCGVGKFGLHKAFRLDEGKEGMEIIPVTSIEHVYLEDLVGYELQKKKLIDNTVAFIEGRKANNVLLFGDSGTGKSSSIKAILNQYYDRGLRMIEVYKHQFQDLSKVIELVKDRNYKFIIYMDDLSFEDYEIEYKYLKAMIEGGLGKKPDNVLIYATSNRRHLVREKFSDMDDRKEDLHTSDTVQEKLSLVARFGVTICYVAPNKKEYQNIVKTLAERYGIDMPLEQLYLEANKWELSHGGLSGRSAQQFINYLLG